MNCEFCGEDITPGALACPRCGGPISKPAEAPAQEPLVPGLPPANAPVVQPPVQPTPPPGAAYQPPVAGPVPPVAPAAAPPVQQQVPDVPLAKAEEDFIALAEETIILDEESSGEQHVDPSVVPQAVPPDAAPGQPLPPGAQVPIQQTVADNSNLIGGYKGPELSSVSGAGEQTADDPFGLNITEKAPPEGGKEPVVWARSWRYSSWWNTTMMVLGILLLVAGIGAAIYFGVLHKSGPGGAPAESLREYVEGVVANDGAEVSKVSTPDSKLASSLGTLLKAYEKYGNVTLKGFETKVVKVNDTSAELQITKFDIQMQDEKGNTEVISVLDITQPFALLKTFPTIQVIKQNGKWFVTS
jgi:hypothetical protein